MHIVSIVHFEPPLEFAPPKGQVTPPPGYSIKTRYLFQKEGPPACRPGALLCRRARDPEDGSAPGDGSQRQGKDRRPEKTEAQDRAPPAKKETSIVYKAKEVFLLFSEDGYGILISTPRDLSKQIDFEVK